MQTAIRCIPLGHIQTYFDLRKSLIMQIPPRLVLLVLNSVYR